MKKLFALVLTLALVLALGTTTFAATLNAVGSTESGNVTASVSSTAAAEVISVDVTWGNLVFTYSTTDTWNPTTHQNDTAGGWGTEFQNVATVVNHSNVALTATAAFTAAAETNFAATFETASQNLATAVGTEVNAAPSATFAMKITAGTPTNNQALGTITITIAKQA